jgi:hypothetical protein
MMVRHRVRYIHRYPLRTSYPDIVASVARLLAQLPEMRDKPELWIDATGVGRAVLNIFQEARLDPVGVAITAGAMAHRVSHSDIRIPKRELASLMQATLQTERVTIARDLAHSLTLEDELSNFGVKLAAGGNESYEGRSGVHDDLVLALAIAVWAAVPGQAGWRSLASKWMTITHPMAAAPRRSQKRTNRVQSNLQHGKLRKRPGTADKYHQKAQNDQNSADFASRRRRVQLTAVSTRVSNVGIDEVDAEAVGPLLAVGGFSLAEEVPPVAVARGSVRVMHPSDPTATCSFARFGRQHR